VYLSISSYILGFDHTPENLTEVDIRAWTELLTPILDLWKSLHQGLTLLQTKMATQDGGSDMDDPITSCVRREFYMGLKIVHRIHKSLATITKCMKIASSPGGLKKKSWYSTRT